MASVHKINETLAQLRGAPTATIEAYSRKLRTGQLLPPTKRGGAATPVMPLHAAYMLFSVMRGSTSRAAENAREIGDLIIREDPLMESVLKRQLASLNWPDGISFANAIAWLIDRYLDGAIDKYLGHWKTIKVSVNRYWPRASIIWVPSKEISREYISAMDEVFPGIGKSIDTTLNGELVAPMEIRFNSPWLHEMNVSYGVDKDRNREAGRQYSAIFKDAETLDIHGDEYVTQKTLSALSKLFKE